MSQFTLLANLDLSIKNPTVRVKVISKWRVNSPSRIHKNTILFCDEKGVTIQGTIRDAFPKSFETIMNEGEWFGITNFKLEHSFGRVRMTKNRYNVILSEKSIIFKSEPTTYCNYYAFKPFGSIICGLAHPMYCIDLYGALVGVGSLETYVLQGDGVGDNSLDNKLVFSLINPEFIQIKCIAYGSTARELHAYWSSIRANVILCVLTFWQIQWGEGGFRFMTNLEGCSKIMFNPSIPEIEAFKKK
ncbi:uncharacterized protein LOC106378221 [Brassica napus]|uniref:uncharacterized protein LOC106378221 n=1 Tax=Brassica napus TaxID=3708 RepID=UPI0006AB304B|nr:uncharacterized protein LOC106378221 [Brassica napus]